MSVMMKARIGGGGGLIGGRDGNFGRCVIDNDRCAERASSTTPTATSMMINPTSGTRYKCNEKNCSTYKKK